MKKAILGDLDKVSSIRRFYSSKVAVVTDPRRKGYTLNRMEWVEYI